MFLIELPCDEQELLHVEKNPLPVGKEQRGVCVTTLFQRRRDEFMDAYGVPQGSPAVDHGKCLGKLRRGGRGVREVS